MVDDEPPREVRARLAPAVRQPEVEGAGRPGRQREDVLVRQLRHAQVAAAAVAGAHLLDVVLRAGQRGDAGPLGRRADAGQGRLLHPPDHGGQRGRGADVAEAEARHRVRLRQREDADDLGRRAAGLPELLRDQRGARLGVVEPHLVVALVGDDPEAVTGGPGEHRGQRLGVEAAAGGVRRGVDHEDPRARCDQAFEGVEVRPGAVPGEQRVAHRHRAADHGEGAEVGPARVGHDCPATSSVVVIS